MEKIWITRGGVVGTAHVDRRGMIVDFRPAGVICHEHGKIVIYPPKGQERMVRPVEVRIVGVDQIISYRDAYAKGHQWVKPIYWGRFQGMDVSASGMAEAVWYGKKAQETSIAANEARDKMRAEVGRQVEEFIDSFTAAQFAAVIGIRGAGRVYRGKVDTVHIAKVMAVKAIEARFETAGVPHFYIWGCAWHAVDRGVSRVGGENIKSAVFGGMSFRRIMGTADYAEKQTCDVVE